MAKRLLFVYGLFLLSQSVVIAQVEDTPDSMQVFTLENFYTIILKYHPTAKQANLLSEVARQQIRMARGNFDPKIEVEVNSKKLNNKTYYETFNSSLKFPTIFPINPSIGFDLNEGTYLNPERYIDNEFNHRQLYAGVSIPLARGLITDERRTALRQAELFREMTEAEQLSIINKLLLEAAKKYWEWYFSFYNYKLMEKSVVIGEEIFRRVRTNYTFGEASVIDTVQASIIWQQRVIDQQEALLNFKNSTIELSALLWDSVSNPLHLTSGYVPVLDAEPWVLTHEGLTELTNLAKVNHPELQKIEVKLHQLEAERRLASEYLKPQLNLTYYSINQPVNPNGEFSFTPRDNYKLGVDLSFPLFLRKERSKLALTRLKMSNTKFERSLTERQILNNITSIHNQLTSLQSIIASQKQMVESYERLLAAELVNLEEGESDLFKINMQQEKLILSQVKWLKLRAEYEKQKAELYWAAGTNRGGQ